MSHRHRHTPCDPCACGLEPFPDGASACSGNRCPDCPPIHPTFGLPMTEGLRELRIHKATRPKLRLVLTSQPTDPRDLTDPSAHPAPETPEQVQET